MNVVALVQARTGSYRFPGKMLAKLGGEPVLKWVLSRVKRSRLISTVVLATTDCAVDDGLVDLAHRLSVEVFRGSEADVLGRLAAAATKFNADLVIRICADNPFVDPYEIDRLVEHFQRAHFDYACNHQDRLHSRYADGFGAEVLSNALLQRIAKLAREPRYREHATLYIWENGKEFCISAVRAPEELSYPELRFDIDSVEDLNSLQTLVEAGINLNSSASEIIQLSLRLMPVTLITTDLATPNAGQRNSRFLGSWCFTSHTNETSARASGRIIPYHWDDREKLKRDFFFLQKINHELIKELTCVLNTIHDKRESERFWKLLLGYWINIYTAVVFDRWASLHRAVALDRPWKMDVLKLGAYSLVTSTTSEFIYKASEDSLWNHSLFSELQKYIPEIASNEVELGFNDPPTKTQENQRKNGQYRREIKKIAIRVFAAFKARESSFLISTYLPRGSLMKLELKLGQVPFPNLTHDIALTSAPDPRMRDWALVKNGSEKGFEFIVRDLLPKTIPTVFLEGFRDLMNAANEAPWPKSPQVIFTSNSHFTDEIFKAWAGKKVSQGARICIGEHGGFGVGEFNGSHAYELSVADKYLSTGWLNQGKPEIIPVGNFRVAGLSVRPKPSGKALLCCVNMPRFSFDVRSMALASQILGYFEDQFAFMDSLPSGLRNQILVRLYPKDYGWDQKARWAYRHPGVSFDTGGFPMLKMLRHCRLFIGTYASTTYIDTLALNFPTVIFWDPGRWEIKPEARAVFDELKAVGIFHDDPRSAGVHVGRIWDSTADWWCSDSVQSARKKFCSSYSSTPKNLIDSIKSVLHSHSV